MAKEYDIAKAGGQCARCGRPLEPGEEFVATVVEAEGGFERRDHCAACWASAPADEGSVFGLWRSRMPQPEQKRKLFVDDDVIIDFFERLAGAEEPAKANFRYVLALVLMRKKRLVYDRSRTDEAGRDVWLMHFRGDGHVHEVVDPKLDEDKIADVSRQLSQIMEVEP